jgi:TctA family transporter
VRLLNMVVLIYYQCINISNFLFSLLLLFFTNQPHAYLSCQIIYILNFLMCKYFKLLIYMTIILAFLERFKILMSIFRTGSHKYCTHMTHSVRCYSPPYTNHSIIRHVSPIRDKFTHKIWIMFIWSIMLS